MTKFDAGCRRCPRLAAFLDDTRRGHPGYHCAPVAPFGDAQPRLLIVGLAPGLHGANASGRPFTGDHAGILLYRTLHELGLASAAESRARDDGLELSGCRITNAVKCVPPGNKPLPVEIANCNRYLVAELAGLPGGCVILALGRIAHDAVLLALGLARSFAAIRSRRGTRSHRRPQDGRFLSLQPVQHADAAPHAGDVPGGRGTRHGARRQRGLAAVRYLLVAPT